MVLRAKAPDFDIQTVKLGCVRWLRKLPAWSQALLAFCLSVLAFVSTLEAASRITLAILVVIMISASVLGCIYVGLATDEGVGNRRAYTYPRVRRVTLPIALVIFISTTGMLALPNTRETVSRLVFPRVGPVTIQHLVVGQTDEAYSLQFSLMNPAKPIC
jgi:hypothetical protein